MAAASNSPVDRPTEWVTAIVGIGTAIAAFTTNHDLAAVIAAVGAFLPTIITLAKETFGNSTPT